MRLPATTNRVGYVPEREESVDVWASALDDPREPVHLDYASPEWQRGRGATLMRGWIRRRDRARIIETDTGVIAATDPSFEALWAPGCG